MTFGFGSPGFNPFWCPPCPDGHLCNTVCFDAIDGTLLMLGAFVVLTAGRYYAMEKLGENDE